MGPKFTKSLSEPWSLADRTLFQGLESWDSVGDWSLLVSLLLRLQMCSYYFWNLFAYLLPSITASSFFVLHSRSAVITFRGLVTGPNIVTGVLKPHKVRGPPMFHLIHCRSLHNEGKLLSNIHNPHANIITHIARTHAAPPQLVSCRTFHILLSFKFAWRHIPKM